MTDEDQRQRTAIMECEDPVQLAQLIYEYYQDADRAERASRPLMYLHMGMLAGGILKLSRERPG